MSFELRDALLQTGDDRFSFFVRNQRAVVPPPIEADLFGFVDRADEQTNADGEQLDVGERDAHIASDDQPLVEDPIQDVNQVGALVPTPRLQAHERETLTEDLPGAPD